MSKGIGPVETGEVPAMHEQIKTLQAENAALKEEVTDLKETLQRIAKKLGVSECESQEKN